MHSKAAACLLGIFMALMLSVGAVIAAFAQDIPTTGHFIILVALPLAALILSCAWVNYKFLIPRYLLRQKYLMYISDCFILAMLIPLFGLAMEAIIRHVFHLPNRLSDCLSPWILVDSLSTASLLMVAMVGMGVARLYAIWRKELDVERCSIDNYRSAIESYKLKIRPQKILDSLDRIKALVYVDPEAANQNLHSLSDTLRRDLYELPKLDFKVDTQETVAPRMADFISSKRYTLLRDVCLKLLIACVSVTAIFEAPDNPNLSKEGLWAFLGMFLILCIITYGAKSLCRHFLEKGKIKLFLTGCGLFMVVMTIVTIVVEYYSYVHTIHNGAPSIFYSILATLSSFCTLSLYLGGVIALVILHNWLCTVKRVNAMKASTAKTELQFLQSQINPHFLFNVLNNAGILITEAPEMASAMLSQLTEIFRYQSSITGKDKVKACEDVAFLTNYLLLEQSRKSPFEFAVKVAEDTNDLEIPALLLIPFVENACKHSCGNRDIRIELGIENDRMNFLCSNVYDPLRKSRHSHGGLGVANTRRRLELIYGNDYKLEIKKEPNRYIIQLSIPIKK